MFHLNESGLVLFSFRTTQHSEAGATVLLKGTFSCSNGSKAVPAAKQRKISGDKRFMDKIGRSLCWPSDLAPHKPYTDVVVIGSWHSPGGRPVRQGRAGFRLGPISRELQILGPRIAAKDRDGAEWVVTEPGSIETLPLRWEYSAGGLRDARNPFGLGQDPIRPGYPIRVDMPQIQASNAPHASPADKHPPENFAPVPAQFSSRKQLAGTRDLRWATFRAPFPPDDFDPSFHNAAPPGQLAGNRPRGDEVVEWHNLNPEHSKLVTQLPGLRPLAAFLIVSDDEPRADMLRLELDTVVCLPDTLEIVLVWRGFVPLGDEEKLVGLGCRTVPLDSKDDGADLPTALVARMPRPTARPMPAAPADLAAKAAKRAEAAAEETHALMGEVSKLADNPALPADIQALLRTETDPHRLASTLQARLMELLAEFSARYPPKA